MEQKSKLSKRKITLILGVLLALIVCGALWWWIAYRNVVSTDDARVKGTVINVSSKVSGRIDKVLVKEGDSIQAGQVIAQIESSEIQVKVAQARANLAAAQDKLAATKAGNRPQQIAQSKAAADQAKANLDNAEKNYNRLENLYEKGAVSVQQLDAAQTALSVAASQYEAASQNYSLTAEGPRTEDVQYAQDQVDQAAAVLRNAELELGNATIKAPVSGVIANKTVENGEFVTTGQPMFVVADLSDVWVAANIEETYVGKVEVGQSAQFTLDAYPGKVFRGHVFEVGSATNSQFSLLPSENNSSNFTKVTQRLPVKIKVDSAEGSILKPGMSAIIKIFTS